MDTKWWLIFYGINMIEYHLVLKISPVVYSARLFEMNILCGINFQN